MFSVYGNTSCVYDFEFKFCIQFASFIQIKELNCKLTFSLNGKPEMKDSRR